MKNVKMKMQVVLILMAEVGVHSSWAADRLEGFSCNHHYENVQTYNTGPNGESTPGDLLEDDNYDVRFERNPDGTFLYHESTTRKPHGKAAYTTENWNLRQLHCSFSKDNPKLFLCVTAERSTAHGDLNQMIYLQSSEDVPLYMVQDPLHDYNVLLSTDGSPVLGEWNYPNGGTSQIPSEGARNIFNFRLFRRENSLQIYNYGDHTSMNCQFRFNSKQ